jgi:two-component system, OmpR family, sensor histidine kinase MprB
MPLRKRVSLAAAATVAVVVALALLICYGVVRDRLLSQVNDQLTAQATTILRDPNPSLNQTLPGLAASAGGNAPYLQVVLGDGEATTRAGGTLPGVAYATSVADGQAPDAFTTLTAHGVSLREYTFKLSGFELMDGQQIAVQIARPLTSVDNVMSDLRLILAIVFLLGVGLAALLGRMAARRVLSPLAEVTATAELIGETDDLGQRLEVHSDDEVGQLAARFNAMLERLQSSRAALDESVRSQRQLVADASHELRTPVTSLRTNVEVLLAGGEIDKEDREKLLADVVEQSEELSTLVNDLIEVARGDLPDAGIEDIRLDRVVEEGLLRARRNSPEVQFLARLNPTVVNGNAERLSRAINNLLDNAARHAGGAPVEVTVDDDGLRVRDHGQGINEEDLPHIFDRFYRGANSRATQGSGLGLAIVRQVAEMHEGSVTAANELDGGAVFTLRLPTSAPAIGGDDSYADGGLVTRA